MSYTKIEIAYIVGNCHQKEEVLEACRRFRYLMIEAEQQHLMFMELLCKKRIEYLVKIK